MTKHSVEVWLKGLLAAAIGGLGTGLAGVYIGIAAHQLKALILVSAAISVGMYLQKSPLPSDQ